MLQPKQTPKEKKNTKDATQMKNMRPVFKGPNSKTSMPKGLSGTAKAGKSISKAKNGKSFPDLNKDGKVTKADILKGRGVIAKEGASVKKAMMGAMAKPMMKSGGKMKTCKGGC